MQYQQTMQGLGDMYNLPVAMMPQAMDLLGQQQRADAMTEQNQGRQLAYDTAEDPLKLQRSSLENQGLQEGLPGITARSAIDVRRNKMGDATYDSEVKAAIAKHGADKVASHAAEAGSIGERLSQMAEEAKGSPLGASERIKAELKAMGHDNLWSPTWDITPGQDPVEHAYLLSKAVGELGGNLQSTSTKFRTAAELAKAKGDVTLQVGAERNAMEIRKAEIAAAARVAAMRKPSETMSQYEARLRAEVAAGNEAAGVALHALEENRRGDKEASAGVAAGIKPNLPAMGIPTNDSVKGTPTPTIPGAKGAIPSDLPQGTKDNGDGTYTLPSGKTVRPIKK